ncbi:MAG: hypothetical protein AAB738_02845 [Patescibacteria group bacterium]
MKQSAKRLISMILSLALMVVAFVVFFNLTQPIYQDIQSEKGVQVAKQSFVDSKKTAIKQVQNLIKSFKEDADLQSAQAAVQISFPNNPDLTGALVQLSGLASLDHLNIQSINIADTPASQTQISSSLGESSQGQNIFSKPFSRITFTLGIIGSYDDFKNFLKKIETNTRIFDVTGIGVSPLAKIGSAVYTYSLQVVAYYQTLPQTQKTSAAATQPKTQF